jgi:hypothetical protein
VSSDTKMSIRLNDHIQAYKSQQTAAIELSKAS